MKNKKEAAYIIQSSHNPNLFLCTNNEFMADGFFGPGHRLQAKVYKTRKNALRSSTYNHRGIVVKLEQ